MDTGEHAMYPESIAGVYRGRPMTFDEADHGRANPNYSNILPPDLFSDNCQSCVLAHEARIRGYNVCAKGFDDENIFMTNLSHFTTKAWIDPKTGKNPKMIRYDGNADKYGDWLDRNVKQGERYFVQFSHKNGAHILTASKNDKGIISLYDPQKNLINTGADSINKKMGNKISGIHKIGSLRVDDLDFNLSYVNAVLQG